MKKLAVKGSPVCSFVALIDTRSYAHRLTQCDHVVASDVGLQIEERLNSSQWTRHQCRAEPAFEEFQGLLGVSNAESMRMSWGIANHDAFPYNNVISESQGRTEI